MIEAKRKLFERFGRLDTWIVGVQYHEGAKGMDSPEVYFDRDPDNPFDPNAVAVFAGDGRQIGHLPRYDAEYFSPLIAEGMVALKGLAGESERGDRLPLALEIYATSKVSEILVRDPRNDWRAIYHNLFIDLWKRLGEYSSATLEEFRNRFRPLAHEQALYPKTQFLYRMLKAHIADLEKQEETRLRQQVLAAIKGMDFGRVAGWPEVTVIPLDADDSAAVQPVEAAAGNASLTAHNGHLQDVLRLLPSRCPYPHGAHGAAVLVHGAWFSLDWFDSAECAQVYWYQMILAGVEKAIREKHGNEDETSRTAENVKTAILETLGRAACSLTGTEEEGGGTRIDIRAGEFAGNARYREAALARLRVYEADSEVVYDEPAPSSRPQRMVPSGNRHARTSLTIDG